MRVRVAQSVSVGSDFDVFAHITNNTAENLTCRLLLLARTVSYNGVLGPECGTKDLLNLSLEPFSGKAMLLEQLRTTNQPALDSVLSTWHVPLTSQMFLWPFLGSGPAYVLNNVQPAQFLQQKWEVDSFIAPFSR